MKKIVILFYLTGICWPALSQNTEADKKALRYLKETEWPKAYREQDTLLLNRILADEFQLIDASGEVSNKRMEIEYIKTHKPSYASFVFQITRLDVFENGTAVVSGTGTIRGKDDKGEYEMTYQSSNVLIKRKGQWKAVGSHVSGVKRKKH
ncbi:MAG: nuclear transport factor 2 family protein [Cytophagales bacterium]|nr:nuclear transport factor 2 family protein [Cytophagales bacterium]